jgi:hypothetical protein
LHKEKIDIIINLFMLCPEKSLSNIVTSIDVLLQKFENPKSSALVKFIDSSTFKKEENKNFITIEDVAWDESYPRIFFACDASRLSKAELSLKVKDK